ncbi:MAG: hypothetical protein JSV44_07605 [Candidatus Zixiibacteriota bacterium]|nr:MAG: hypothetical protein JSV44_07605 [candidate division Zixibacteria bacterium]
MRSFKFILSGLLLAGLIWLPRPVPCHAFRLIQDLVVNYSDFSYVRSIAVGFEYAYFGTTEGIVRYNINTKKWDEPMTGIGGLEGTDIYEIQVSTDDEYLWVRTDFGIYEYSHTVDYWVQVDQIPPVNSQSRHLAPDPIFFAPIGYNYMSTGVLVDFDGRRFSLTDIVDDGWGNLWIGIWGLGAARADNSNYRIELLPYGLLQQDISSIHLDSGMLWMSGNLADAYRPGMTVFNWRENQFDYVNVGASEVFITERINDIYANGWDVFVATDHGIMVVDKRTREIGDRLNRRSGLPDDRVLSVAARGDTLFAGTDYGLGLLKRFPDSVEISVQSFLPSLSIFCIEMTTDAVWIGTSRGVFRLHFGSGKLGRLTAPEVSPTGNVHDIELSGQKMWVATEDNLVSIDMETAAIEQYPEVNGYGRINAIAVADTLIAVGTGDGLMLLYTGIKPRHYFYTANDGLISNQINDLVFDGEYLWIATDHGLTRFWYKNPRLPQ